MAYSRAAPTGAAPASAFRPIPPDKKVINDPLADAAQPNPNSRDMTGATAPIPDSRRAPPVLQEPDNNFKPVPGRDIVDPLADAAQPAPQQPPASQITNDQSQLPAPIYDKTNVANNPNYNPNWAPGAYNPGNYQPAIDVYQGYDPGTTTKSQPNRDARTSFSSTPTTSNPTGTTQLNRDTRGLGIGVDNLSVESSGAPARQSTTAQQPAQTSDPLGNAAQLPRTYDNSVFDQNAPPPAPPPRDVLQSSRQADGSVFDPNYQPAPQPRDVLQSSRQADGSVFDQQASTGQQNQAMFDSDGVSGQYPGPVDNRTPTTPPPYEGQIPPGEQATPPPTAPPGANIKEYYDVQNVNSAADVQGLSPEQHKALVNLGPADDPDKHAARLAAAEIIASQARNNGPPPGAEPGSVAYNQWLDDLAAVDKVNGGIGTTVDESAYNPSQDQLNAQGRVTGMLDDIQGGRAAPQSDYQNLGQSAYTNAQAAGMGQVRVGDMMQADIYSIDSLDPIAREQAGMVGPTGQAQVGNTALYNAAQIGPTAQAAATQLGSASQTSGVGVDGTQLSRDDLAIRENQIQQLNRLNSSAEGTGPSRIEGNLQQATEQGLAAQLAAAASQRGSSNVGGLRRGLAQNAAIQQANAAGMGAEMGIEERLAAEQQLQGALAGTREQDLGAASTQAQLDASARSQASNQEQQARLSNMEAENNMKLQQGLITAEEHRFNAQQINQQRTTQAQLTQQAAAENASSTNQQRALQAQLSQQALMQDTALQAEIEQSNAALRAQAASQDSSQELAIRQQNQAAAQDAANAYADYNNQATLTDAEFAQRREEIQTQAANDLQNLQITTEAQRQLGQLDADTQVSLANVQAELEARGLDDAMISELMEAEIDIANNLVTQGIAYDQERIDMAIENATAENNSRAERNDS